MFFVLHFLDASTQVGPSIGRSVHPSVRNPFFSNPRKRPFSATEMDGIELVVTRGEEGGMVVTGGDDGWGRI